MGLDCGGKVELASRFVTFGKSVNHKCHCFFLPQQAFRQTTYFRHIIMIRIVVIDVFFAIFGVAAKRFSARVIDTIVDVEFFSDAVLELRFAPL